MFGMRMLHYDNRSMRILAAWKNRKRRELWMVFWHRQGKVEHDYFCSGRPLFWSCCILKLVKEWMVQ